MIWKVIQNLNYEISNEGLVRNITTKRIISYRKLNSKAYYTVFLRVNKKPCVFAIHRLVAIAFIENKFDKPQVNHIDGNKYNNLSSNLEWVTRSENMKHMYKKGLKKYKPLHYKGKFAENHNRSKKVKCVQTGIIYGSQMEAQRQLNLSNGSVSWSIKHKKPIFGMHFETAI